MLKSVVICKTVRYDVRAYVANEMDNGARFRPLSISSVSCPAQMKVCT